MFVGVVDGSVTSELRRSVLRPTWPPGSVMHGDSEPDALHIAAVDDHGVAVCACVLFPRAYPGRSADGAAWQLRGMATAPELRSHGLGGLVVEAAAAEVGSRGASLLWCEAREAAIAFYERHGFLAEGDRYLHSESGIGHRMMVRELSFAPTSSDG
jgi:ribosomal protein S18 acetylase RimI-like enzyme